MSSAAAATTVRSESPAVLLELVSFSISAGNIYVCTSDLLVHRLVSPAEWERARYAKKDDELIVRSESIADVMLSGCSWISSADLALLFSLLRPLLLLLILFVVVHLCRLLFLARLRTLVTSTDSNGIPSLTLAGSSVDSKTT